jgi:cell wall-associated NlpC family hydrolase
MNKTNQQSLIVQTARTWLGTKFHHQGRIKRNKQNLGGCDCIGLIIGVGNELNIKPHNKNLSDYDTVKYGRTHKRNQLNDSLSSCFTKTSKISRGTILVFQINPDLQHCAIVSEIKNLIKIIHCDAKAKKVVENNISDSWLRKIIGIYNFPEIPTHNIKNDPL